jgi:hypothetical protein
MRRNISDVARRMTGRGTEVCGAEGSRCGEVCRNTNSLCFSASNASHFGYKRLCVAINVRHLAIDEKKAFFNTFYVQRTHNYLSCLAGVDPGSRVFILSYIESVAVHVHSLLRGASSLAGDSIDLQQRSSFCIQAGLGSAV